MTNLIYELEYTSNLLVLVKEGTDKDVSDALDVVDVVDLLQEARLLLAFLEDH